MLRLALHQSNPSVGDCAANAEAILAARTAHPQADLLLTPELSLLGYPPEDLVLKPAFLDAAEAALARLAAATADGGPALLVGTARRTPAGLLNAFVLLEGGRVAGETFKHDLPNYGVFDEKRVFVPGPLPGPIAFRGQRLGIPICEDMWTPPVAAHLKAQGATLLLVPNGSPFELGKDTRRLALARARVAETGLPLVYLNRVGGQDELVFDGASFALDATGRLAARLPDWEEATTTLALDASGRLSGGPLAAPGSEEEDIWHAMCVGLGDYVRRNRFPGVVLGLSGGIDSAVSAAVAVDALGPESVWCLMLPSRYTSAASREDAEACARLLGVRLDTIGIEPAVEAMGAMLAPLFEGLPPGIAEENIQSRLRMVAVMAVSNKFGHMPLTTGNKSEMSVGYATIYGDMAGGYSVLKDLYKTTVLRLARWRNTHRPRLARGPAGPVMPQRVIDKPPTAELRADQKDEDSLPPYHRLDRILEGLIEDERSAADLVAEGHDAAEVQRIERLLHIAEYKRRQAPPGVKIGRRSFGRDRRYPITHGFRTP